MPVVTLYGIPPEASEDSLEQLIEVIQSAVAKIPEMELTTDDISVFMPPDRVKKGLGEEIIIRVTEVFDRPRRNKMVLQKIATALSAVVAGWFPNTGKVECFVYLFDVGAGDTAFHCHLPLEVPDTNRKP